MVRITSMNLGAKASISLRRFIAILISLTMILSISGCGPKEASNTPEDIEPITIEREPESESLQAANKATTIALKQYIHARLATEIYMSLDPSTMTMGELAQMADDVLLAWENAEALSASAEEITNGTVKELEKAAIDKSNNELITNSLLNKIIRISRNNGSTAYAAEAGRKLDPQTWAENLTKQYDEIRGGQRYHQLASQLGTDARTAYEQMALAQKIISNAAALEEAEADVNAWTESINYLQGVKTASKVGVFVVGTIVTGGGTVTALGSSSMTLGTATGVVVGGADCIVDIGATGSSIILGENNQVTIGFNELKDKLAPVSAVVGLAGFNAAETGEQLSYIGDSLVDWFYEGKFMGVKVDNGDVTARILDSAGKEALKSALEAIGYVFPEETKTIQDLVKEYKDSVDIDSVWKEMEILISEMGKIESNQGISDAISPETDDPETPSTETPLTGINIFGKYNSVSKVSTMEDPEVEIIEIRDVGDGSIVWIDGDGDETVLSYDKASNSIHWEEEGIVFDLDFTSSGGEITGFGTMTGLFWGEELNATISLTKISD